MKFTRIYAIFLRQMLLLRHNPTRFINIFIWIILDVVLWGFITKYLDEVGNAGFSFIPSILGAIILWDFLVRVQQGIMLAFLEDIWSRNLLNLFASPLRLKEYVTGLVATSIVTSTAGLLLMLLLAGFFFGYNVFVFGAYLLLFLLILFLFGIALGIFAAAIILRFGPSAEWFSWPIPFILAPFAGVYYPINTLPAIAQAIARFIPPSYAFEGMRGILFFGTLSAPTLLIGIVLALVYIFLAYLFLARIYKHVLKTGLITRFTAENG